MNDTESKNLSLFSLSVINLALAKGWKNDFLFSSYLSGGKFLKCFFPTTSACKRSSATSLSVSWPAVKYEYVNFWSNFLLSECSIYADWNRPNVPIGKPNLRVFFLKAGPNTSQKWQRLPFLDARKIWSFLLFCIDKNSRKWKF